MMFYKGSRFQNSFFIENRSNNKIKMFAKLNLTISKNKQKIMFLNTKA